MCDSGLSDFCIDEEMAMTAAYSRRAHLIHFMDLSEDDRVTFETQMDFQYTSNDEPTMCLTIQELCYSGLAHFCTMLAKYN